MAQNKYKEIARRLLPNFLYGYIRGLLRRRQPRAAKLAFNYPGPTETSSPFKFAYSQDNPLEALGEKYGPTKRLHNYLVYYWAHFRDIRYQVRTVLEIGLETDRSIRMWEEFFPNATIVGIDINPDCRAFEGDRRRIFIGDQSDERFLESVLKSVSHAFDIVIDDGSHYVPHQIASFNYLFPRMSSHGLYVLEDTGGCVEDYRLATVNAMKPLIDSIMHWPKGHHAHDWQKLHSFGSDALWEEKHVIGIAFYRWMVVVMRGANPGDNRHLRR